MTRPSVCVTIVTFNSARFIARCLEFVLAQDYDNFDIVVIDNASSDETPRILSLFEHRVRLIFNDVNTGFAAAQNQAISLCCADWILTLNPDVRLSPDFLTMMMAAGEADPEIGSVSGKLLAMEPDFEIPVRPVLDSTGIYFTPNLRHFDRASRQPDTGLYEQFEYVFGVTGAAALYRREMIQDVSCGTEFFDSDFFAYREDADVAWRAQWLGWKCIYTPCAVAWHVRTVLPENRRSLPPLLNMHSVKNRFLMRIKDIDARLYFKHFFSITARDVLIVGACLSRELSSLRAFPLLIRDLPRTWAKRKALFRARRVTSEYISAWFSDRPVSFPAPRVAARALASLVARR